MAKNFLRLIKEISPQNQGAQKIPRKINKILKAPVRKKSLFRGK